MIMIFKRLNCGIALFQVFSGADVKTSLSHEAALFTSANRDFRLLMRASEKNPNVLQCCQRKGIKLPYMPSSVSFVAGAKGS